MIDPKSVISPKNKIKSEINIVIQEKGFTIATFIYGESRKIGIRWNETSPGNKGYPIISYNKAVRTHLEKSRLI